MASFPILNSIQAGPISRLSASVWSGLSVLSRALYGVFRPTCCPAQVVVGRSWVGAALGPPAGGTHADGAAGGELGIGTVDVSVALDTVRQSAGTREFLVTAVEMLANTDG